MKEGSEVKYTKAELEAAGISTEQVEAMTAKVKAMQDKGAAHDSLIAAMTELTAKQSEMTTAISKAVSERHLANEADAFDAANTDAFVAKFAAVKSSNPEEALRIYNTMAEQYGSANAELALTGSDVQKALNRPVTKHTKGADEINEYRKAFDDTYLYTAMMGGIESSHRGNDQSKIDWTEMKRSALILEKQGLEGADKIVKLSEKAINEAMDTLTSTQGSEWLPTAMSANLAEDVWLSLRIASIYRRYTMPTKSFDVPIRTSRALAYRMAEATTNTQFFTNLATANSMNTSKVTFSANKLAALSFISDELEEDAILPVLEMLREDVIYGLNYAIEDACLNGATAADLDGALWTGTTDARSTWGGLRKGANAAEKTDLSTFNLSALRNMRKPMGKYSTTPDQLVYIVSPQTHIELLKLAEVVTLEKYGPNATVLQGEIGKIDGIPIIISPVVYTNLNASGVYDGTTTTKTMIALVNKTGYAFGDRRLVRVESERQALAGQRFVLSTWRGDFKKMYASAEPVTAVGFNVTP